MLAVVSVLAAHRHCPMEIIYESSCNETKQTLSQSIFIVQSQSCANEIIGVNDIKWQGNCI